MSVNTSHNALQNKSTKLVSPSVSVEKATTYGYCGQAVIEFNCGPIGPRFEAYQLLHRLSVFFTLPPKESKNFDHYFYCLTA